MTSIVIIVASVCFLLLLRIGVKVVYNNNLLKVIAVIGILPVTVYKKEILKADQKDRFAFIDTAYAFYKKYKEQQVRKKAKQKKPKKKSVSIENTTLLLKTGREVIKRVRAKLLIKYINIRYIAGAGNPADTAKAYGTVNFILISAVPLLKHFLRVKKTRLHVSADFELDKPIIEAKVALSIAIWELIYIALPLLVSNKSGISFNKKILNDKEQQNGTKRAA